MVSKQSRICTICGQVQEGPLQPICQRCGAPLGDQPLPRRGWTWLRAVLIVAPLALLLGLFVLWLGGAELSDLTRERAAVESTPTEASVILIPTSLPTETPTPTPTATPTLTPTAQAMPVSLEGCDPPAAGVLAKLWKIYQLELGCPLEERAVDGVYAEQPFEHGHMFWSERLDSYLALVGTSEGDWYLFDDSPWQEGLPEESCVLEPPEGLQVPIRGFGGIWCENPMLRGRLGWALDRERGIEDNIDLLHRFERGYIFRDSQGKADGLAYVLFEDGTFIRVEY